ncbi:MAG: hypothetical protein RQ750_17130 [Roseovarius sp.]|nr:hypothetical protein [Roseovarius sp.]
MVRPKGKGLNGQFNSLSAEEWILLFETLEQWERYLAQLDPKSLRCIDDTLDHNFNGISKQPAENRAGKAKYPPPFSIRFTFEERARLDVARGSKALSTHIRDCLFGDDVTPRKRPGNSPVKDAEALGRILGALGASRLSSNLNQLAKAVNTCGATIWMRRARQSG